MEHGLAAAIALDQSIQGRQRHHLVADPVGQVHQHGCREPPRIAHVNAD
jgi:hypothetical protein